MPHDDFKRAQHGDRWIDRSSINGPQEAVERLQEFQAPGAARSFGTPSIPQPMREMILAEITAADESTPVQYSWRRMNTPPPLPPHKVSCDPWYNDVEGGPASQSGIRPAYEINTNPDVPVGAVVELWPSLNGESMFFIWQPGEPPLQVLTQEIVMSPGGNPQPGDILALLGLGIGTDGKNSLVVWGPVDLQGPVKNTPLPRPQLPPVLYYPLLPPPPGPVLTYAITTGGVLTTPTSPPVTGTPPFNLLFPIYPGPNPTNVYQLTQPTGLLLTVNPTDTPTGTYVITRPQVPTEPAPYPVPITVTLTLPTAIPPTGTLVLTTPVGTTTVQLDGPTGVLYTPTATPGTTPGPVYVLTPTDPVPPLPEPIWPPGTNPNLPLTIVLPPPATPTGSLTIQYPITGTQTPYNGVLNPLTPPGPTFTGTDVLGNPVTVTINPTTPPVGTISATDPITGNPVTTTVGGPTAVYTTGTGYLYLTGTDQSGNPTSVYVTTGGAVQTATVTSITDQQSITLTGALVVAGGVTTFTGSMTINVPGVVVSIPASLVPDTTKPPPTGDTTGVIIGTSIDTNAIHGGIIVPPGVAIGAPAVVGASTAKFQATVMTAMGESLGSTIATISNAPATISSGAPLSLTLTPPANVPTWKQPSIQYGVYLVSGSTVTNAQGLVGVFGPFSTPGPQTITYNGDAPAPNTPAAPPAVDTTGTSTIPTVTSVNVVPLANPPAPTVQPITTGASTHTYKIVYNDGAGSTVASAGTTITNGASVPNNAVTWPPNRTGLSTDVYRTAGGSTQGKIGRVYAGQPQVLIDANLAGDSSTAPAANNTGRLQINGVDVVAGASGPAFLTPNDYPGTTTNSYVTVFDAVSSNGVQGSFGVRTTGNTNTLNVRVTWTSRFASDTSQDIRQVGPNSTTSFNVDDTPTAHPPIGEVLCEVESFSAGNSTTYDVKTCLTI
jgi:hypothetical protein